MTARRIPTNPALDGCEVRDYVVGPDYYEVRQQNQAANLELARRSPVDGTDRFGGLSPSGEAAPYGIVWIDTCTGAPVALDVPAAPGDFGYGLGFYGISNYGGEPS